MASTQPLPPPRTSPLRVLRRLSTVPKTSEQPTEAVPDLRTGALTLDKDIRPFSLAEDLAADPSPLPVGHLPIATADLAPRQTGYLHGVSLAAILQMLHLERKTCVIEASCHGWLGSLTLVNGELVDAAVGEISGEDAACTVLNWLEPQVSILDRTDLFRHTVQRPITQLIMDAARMVDETGALDPALGSDGSRLVQPSPHADWRWLAESLELTGARNVQILDPESIAAGKNATGMLGDASADLARGIRTWAALLGPNVTEVVAYRGELTLIFAVLDADRSEYLYAEAPGAETAELVRRVLRSIKR